MIPKAIVPNIGTLLKSQSSESQWHWGAISKSDKITSKNLEGEWIVNKILNQEYSERQNIAKSDKRKNHKGRKMDELSKWRTMREK